ncbi:MAG TPA: hypothetical protein VFZ01_05345 [Geminicoccaceae bacterium]
MDQAAAARRVDLEVSFEVYVQKNGRWLTEDVLDDREAALRLGRQLTAHKDHEAVKVVREQLDPTTARGSERIILDSRIPLARPLPAAPRPRAESGPAAVPEPVIRHPGREPEPGGPPWLVPVSAVLGLTFAALGLWITSAVR